jgi:hypothetical protein
MRVDIIKKIWEYFFIFDTILPYVVMWMYSKIIETEPLSRLSKHNKNLFEKGLKKQKFEIFAPVQIRALCEISVFVVVLHMSLFPCFTLNLSALRLSSYISFSLYIFALTSHHHPHLKLKDSKVKAHKNV